MTNSEDPDPNVPNVAIRSGYVVFAQTCLFKDLRSLWYI